MNKLLYIPAFFLLTLVYYLNFSNDTMRLPWYFFPDGTVVHMGDNIPKEKIQKIYKINNTSPPVIDGRLKDFEMAEVSSDKGTFLIRTVLFSYENLLEDFLLPVVFSYIFLLAGVWFRHFGNDWHISIFCFSMSILIFLSIAVLTQNRFVFFWLVFLFAMPSFILNVGLRVTGRSLTHIMLMIELVLTIFIALIAYVGRNYDYTMYNIRILSWYLLLFVIFLVSLFLVDVLIKKHDDAVDKIKKAVLFAGFSLGFLVPLLMFQYSDLWYEGGNIFTIPSLFFFIFPVSLLYGTYRIYLVPFQLVFTKSLLAAVLAVLLMAIYGMVLMAHSIFLPEQNESEQWIVNLIFVMSLVFFLDPARRRLSALLESRLFRLSPDLTASLERIASNLSSPKKSSHSVEFFLSEIKKTLDLSDAGILLSDEVFPQLTLKNIKIFRIKDSSNFWKDLLPDKLVVTSYLTYSGGSRAGLYRFLFANDIYIAVGVKGSVTGNQLGKNNRAKKRKRFSLSPIKAAMLLGSKKDRRRYRLSEIRYLQEASRLAAMMIDDYAMLVREIERRKKMRELSVAAEIQNSLINLDKMKFEAIKVSSFNLPAISVSGDYMDIIPMHPGRCVCLLGDVSGHGLGTGYLVSVVRAIVRSHLEAGEGLKETFDLLNHFLINRYKGHEYLTLLAFDLDFKTGNVSHINAAHPSPFLYDPESDEIRKISYSQKLLGAFPGSYKVHNFKITKGQRLFLYSDGVTETFDGEDRPFGEMNLMDFLKDNRKESLDVIGVTLKDRLYDFRGRSTPSDDTTFLAIEYLHADHTNRMLFPAIDRDANRQTES